MKKIIYICFFLCLSFYGYGQISTNEEPYSWNISTTASSKSLKKSVPVIEMPALDRDALEKEDKADEENGNPPRFGFRHPVKLDMDNSGIWEETPDGGKLWKLEIRSPDALSLNLLYDKFWLPEGAKFFVYSSDKKNSIGAFTSLNNKGTQDNPKGFATGLIYSNDITLEYYEPKDAYGGIISIAYIVSGYKYILANGSMGKNFGDSYSCHANINCCEGTNWQNEKNAVALILVNGNRYCTGALLNTTAEDYRPYLLTADHCLGGWGNNDIKYDAETNPDLSHWSFIWNYELPECGSSENEPPVKITNGATVLANLAYSDFALLRLTENPIFYQDVLNLYYLGWDCTGLSGAGGVGIHHPYGDVKKISVYYENLTNNRPFTVNDWTSYSHWIVHWGRTAMGYSGTEGGSSGSPLINNSHRVIGQLSGGPSMFCIFPNLDYYGKFSASWMGDVSGNPSRRLKDWLDPTNTYPPYQGCTWDGKAFVCDKVIIANQIISSSQNIKGCEIEISETSITNNATVEVTAIREVLISSDFEVTEGTVFSLETGKITP